MNCKPGDVVMVIKSRCGNEGRIGVVREPIALQGVASSDESRGWIVDGRFRWCGWCDDSVMEGDWGQFPDAWLRPLRDEDGLDETLQLIELPASPLGVEHVE